MPDPAPLTVEWGAKARQLVARYIADHADLFASLSAARARRVSFVIHCNTDGEPHELTIELDTQRRVRAVR